MVSTLATHAAHRLVHRVLQRRAPRLHRHDLGAEQLHAPHVERLALDVDRAHVDGAAQAEQRGRGRGRRRRAGPRRSPRSRAACPCGASAGLAEHVVDLVRAGVGEVFALQQHAHAEPLREPVALGDRRRPARVARQQRRVLGRGTRRRATRRGTRARAARARARASPARSGRRTRRSGRARRARVPAARGARAVPRRGTSASSEHDIGRIVRGRRAAESGRQGLLVDLPVPRAGSIAGDSSSSCQSTGVTSSDRRRRRSRVAEVGRASSTAAAARAASMNRRSLPGSLRPGAASTPLDTSTPHGRTSADRLADVLGREPAGEQDALAARRALGQPPVEDLARAGSGESTRMMSAGLFAAAASAGSPAANAWITNCTRSRIHCTSDAGSRPCSCTPCSPAATDDLDDALRALVAEHADRVHLARQPPHDVAHGLGHRPGARLGANTKPSASAPSATASSASSSLVIPQILTNTRATATRFRRRSGDRG